MDAIKDAIQSMSSSISSWFNGFLNVISSIADFTSTMVDIIGQIGSFFWGLIRFIGEFFKVLFTLLGQLIDHIFGLSGMAYLGETLQNISSMIGLDNIYFIMLFVVCLLLTIFKFMLRLFKGINNYKSPRV